MDIKIVSDSSSNVFELEDVSFENVPLRIITEQEEFVDNKELDVADMVEKLHHYHGKSGTSCPNVHDWLQAYEGAEQVFAVTISSNMSGSCTAATQAASLYEQDHPGARVHVVDSLSAGPELGLLIGYLRRQIREGKSFEEIRKGIQEYMSHTHLLFSLQSLNNLARNGRVNPAVAKLAGVLGIRIVGAASEEGTFQQLHKARGEKKALEAVFEEMKKRGYKGGRVRIAQCFNTEAAQELGEMIKTQFEKAKVKIESCSGLCSFYAERGGLLVGYEDL